jgi:SAM-dependent methyltransferase
MNYSDIKTLLSLSLVHKYLTSSLLRFVDEQGISAVMASLKDFTLEDALSSLKENCGFSLSDKVRARMIKVLVDFLCECRRLQKNGGRYSWRNGDDKYGLTLEESSMAEKFFTGQIDFFEQCIQHAGRFMRGDSPLYGFDKEAAHIWEKFLGNPEFNFARSVLAQLMLSDGRKDPDVLDLCYGPGFDILKIQETLAGAKVTAIDFKDIFRSRALSRIPNPDAVRWIDSGNWGGFGTELPFPDNSFDVVFFACADPYIAWDVREFVYRDIYRVTKSGGSLNILSHSYPDPERIFVEDEWVRRGTLCHDFAESVCAGWHGFYGAAESLALFELIGFRVGTVMMNSSIWRLDKPW